MSMPQWFADSRGAYAYALAVEDGVEVIRFSDTNRVKWRADCGKCISPEAMGDSDFWPEHESGCRHSYTVHCPCRFD
jgi:hypothetical protein